MGNLVQYPAVDAANSTAQFIAPSWYAVQTRPRYEKKVADHLQFKGIGTFLPLLREVHRWSDRKKTVDVPLFPGYAFVHIAPEPAARAAVLRVDGILSFVGSHHGGTPIPEAQIEHVRCLLSSGKKYEHYPFLKAGQRVVIRGGVLEGIEGILVAQSGRERLVISIDGIQRSLAISVEGYDVRPI